MPTARLENGNWPHPHRLPLGCGWNGHCTAPGHEGELPPQHILEAFCNLGYATSCSWAPQQRDWDAVRFAVSAPERSARDRHQMAENASTRMLRLSYVCERNHRPVAHGDLAFDLATATWLQPHRDVRIQRMAECFLDSYLKRKA
jgi:hypothetical protein